MAPLDLLRLYCFQNLSTRVQLILVDRVGHAGVTAQVDLRTHPLQHLRGFLDARPWNVRVDVTAAEQDRRSRQVAGVLAGRARGAD